jgi:hypothetical protein
MANKAGTKKLFLNYGFKNQTVNNISLHQVCHTKIKTQFQERRNIKFFQKLYKGLVLGLRWLRQSPMTYQPEN